MSVSAKYFKHLATILITLSILISIIHLYSTSNVVYAEFKIARDRVFGYTINLSSIGIIPKYVSILDSSRVLVVGTIRDVHGAAVLDISNPYRDPIVEDMYPLTGLPTCTANDGFPVTQIAIGSDRGEILLFKVDRGRITKHLHIVLGSDFYVNKIFLAKDVRGDTKILALVSEGGPGTSPCTHCHLYILDEEAQGVFRIGPKVGNATALGRMYEGMYIQDVAPLTVYDDERFYWDASNVLIAYIPHLIRLTFNVTYIQNGTAVPIPGALVEVNVTARNQFSMIYGVNADERGMVRVPIQAHPTKISIIMSIRDLLGRILWKYNFTYDPALYREPPDEIPIPNAILPHSHIDTRPAEKIYGVPAFLKARLMLIDATPAPFSITSKASATFYLDTPIRGFFFIRGAEDRTGPKLVYGTSAGYVWIVNVIVFEQNKTIKDVVSVGDYVGAEAWISQASSYSDGSYVLVGLVDGRLRVYIPHVREGYRLKYIYTLSSAIKSLIIVPGMAGYNYVAVSLSGVQVFRLDPYPLPVFRNILSLHISSPSYIDGDTLSDLSAIALIDPNSVIIIKNVDAAVGKQKALSVDNILARDIVINIRMPGNENTSDVIAVFMYPGGFIEYRLNGSTSLVLRNIIPNLEYKLNISTTRPYIYNSSIKFVLRDNMSINITEKHYAIISTKSKCCTLDLGLRYKEYNVTIWITDNFGRTLIAPIDIYVDGVRIKNNTRENVHTSRFLYGTHKIVIKPSAGFEDVYQETSLELDIDKDTVVNATIQRKTYNVMFKVVDGLTNSYPIAPIVLSIFGAEHILAPENYVINITVPYGAYKVKLAPGRGYENVYSIKEITIDVPKVRIYAINMSRIEYEINIELKDEFSDRLIAPVNLYLNGTLITVNTTESRLVRKIPYGNWTIKVKPSNGYERIYEVKELEIFVNKDASHKIIVPRVQYTLAIDLVDIYGKIISPLNISIHGPTNIEEHIEPPGRTIYLLLPYGRYNIVVEPLNRSIYIPYSTTIDVDASQNIKIPIQRVKYRLEIIAEDRYVGVVIGRFDLYSNGTKIAENMVARTSVELPYGVYSLQLVPSREWDRGYNPSQPIIINLVGNTSVRIPIDRKIYTLKLVAVEGANPIRNAVVTIYSGERAEIVTQLITDSNGAIETKLPYGSYRVVVSHPDYITAEVPYITLDNDRSELMSMSPTILALIWRYTPIIVTLIGIGITIYVIMKIRAILARRLIPEEELF